ncbi:MFS transporter superfamily [Sesbania bispinosa]|nr:MFS transporter superfamily [Sesbania bispinosa]
MADPDPTPLLCRSNDDTEPPNEHLPSLGSTIEQCIGEFNWTQFLQAVLVSFAWVFDAQQTFISVFTDAQPPWHCTEQHSCNVSSICNLPKGSWAWDGPTQASIISEWALECENSILTGLPASMFFVGCLVGGLLLATLADTSLGRKNMLFFSCLLMSLSSLLATFSSNIWVYSSLKFLCGFGRATIGTSALVLASELVGKRWRGQISVIGFFCFTLGFLSLPAMAYINRASSWRNLYLWTSIPSIFYCILVKLLVQESPRWLLVRGMKDEAVVTLKCITSITQSSLYLAINNMSHEEENWGNVDLYSALRILLQKKWSSRRLMAIMAMGFGIGLVYYGMPLGLGILSFNLYLSVTFNALSELPSSLITFFLIDKFRRRSALFVFTVLSGVFSVMSIMEGKVWSEMQIGFELMSFFSACTAFNVYLIYSTELFPTCVRNSGLSMARLAVVFGGSFSPLLVGAGRGHKFLCYGVFGLVIGCSGVFGVFLPETKGRALCDTMDEEENKEKKIAGGGDILA